MKPTLKTYDGELAFLLAKEKSRQKNTLEMIASESVQSPVVLALQGSAFNNKTAVGLPGHQRLGGSQVIDDLERLCCARACEVFGADHAVVSTYSGSTANYCAYSAVLNPGDRSVALDSAAGSHQTHGSRNNVSSGFYRFRYFGLNPDTNLIDYDGAEALVKEFQPKLLVVGSSAYPREVDFARLSRIAHENGAKLLVDLAHFSGLVAAGVCPNPMQYADMMTISGTKTMCGPHTGLLLCTKEMAEEVDRAVYPGVISSLHLQTIAAMAYSLKQAKTEEFGALMRQVVKNAAAFSAALQKRGFGILTGGTDCHMVWVDLRGCGLDAVEMTARLEKIGISVNTKGIPYDTSSKPRGIRAGTVVLTQRGMTERDMETVADLWEICAKAPTPANLKAARRKVAELIKAFPLPTGEFGGKKA